jgi:lysophospholipase L1-like esterase
LYYSNDISKGDIVFLGDSLTEGFNFNKYFPENNLKNRGVSGDMTFQVIYRLNGIINALPAKIFLMIGVNDIVQDVDLNVIFSNYLQIITRIQKENPEGELIIQNLLPVNEAKLPGVSGLNTIIYQFNDRLRKYCLENNLTFIDLHSYFLNDSGEMDPIFTFDGIHLSNEGYKNWALQIKEHL